MTGGGKPKNGNGHGPLDGEETLGRVYRGGANELPPSALDDKILAAARDAVEAPRAQRRSMKRWAAPMSAAALVLLSVGIVYELVRAPAPEQYKVTQTTLADKAADAGSNTVVASESAAGASADNMQATSLQARAKRSVATPAAIPERREETVALNRAAEPAAPAAAPAETERLTETAAPAADRAAAAAGTKEEKSGARALAKQAPRRVTAIADVISVTSAGHAGTYAFTVTVSSADVDCERYADWWEIIDEHGTLIYREVFTHSHANEQPFTSVGKPVSIAPERKVWVRAHMRGQGYGGIGMAGTALHGFAPAVLDARFAADLAERPPQPDRCTF